MTATRRQFTVWGVGLLTGLAGCSEVFADESLTEVQLDLTNRTDGSQTFHFALEATDGLGQWHTFPLEGGSTHHGVVEPAADRAWVGYHAIAGDKQVSGTLLGQAEENACLHLTYRIEADQIVASMPTSQALC